MKLTPFALLFVVLIIFSFVVPQSYAQDLFGERIRKLTGSKKSIFLDSGIFHNGSVGNPTELKSIRSHYDARQNHERIVFDFEGKSVPRVYGYIAGSDKKITIDFFDTGISPALRNLVGSQFVHDVVFLPMGKESLAVEMTFKKKISADIFYLDSPGRLVIDLK